MTDHQDNINRLLEKLELLLKRQEDFSKEIRNLQTEIEDLKSSGTKKVTKEEDINEEVSVTTVDFETKKGETETIESPNSQKTTRKRPGFLTPRVNKTPKIKSNIEKFIGENLINKIGILITIIGVGIGAKYSIENDLISPLTRIILGYLVGIGLLGFGIRLKKNYKNYSAVLVSGAMAIMYFITYFAYDFYDLIPQIFAFALMVVFTIFTVIAALNYDKQIIAHIGLVGAYAVPFLLSSDSGNAAILFSYMAIINIGILIISFKKYWKALYYLAFVLTWFIYFFWIVTGYENDQHFELALIFLSLFFIIFYLTILAYKLIRKEKFGKSDILLLLGNAFIFYGIGYAILSDHKTGEELLGLFTLVNAVIHFIVSVIIYRQKLADKKLFYLVSGLVLVFITIAIPVQLDGNWVSLLWAGEAALLFWIGRTKNIATYEKLSYPVIYLAFFSILHDWATMYDVYNVEQPETRIKPIFNVNFLTSLLVTAAFGFIHFLNQNKNYTPALSGRRILSKIVSYSISAILLYTLYSAFRIEITTYWDQLYMDSALTITREGQAYPSYYHDSDLKRFKIIWVINYTLLFFSILSFINFRKIQNRQFGFVNLGLNILAIAAFLMIGLYELSGLRDSYLDQTLAEYYQRGSFNVIIRYISYVFVALTMIACHQYIRQKFMKIGHRMTFDLLFHFSVLWILSSELIHWMDIVESDQSYKLGLSILWGVYSLLMIILGIWKQKKYLRIGAIILFGITLIKLFFYDISHMDTISKTILLVSLGVILLVISFLYNKYKHVIFDESEN